MTALVARAHSCRVGVSYSAAKERVSLPRVILNARSNAPGVCRRWRRHGAARGGTSQRQVDLAEEDRSSVLVVAVRGSLFVVTSRIKLTVTIECTRDAARSAADSS